MARRKKPEGETQEQSEIRRTLELISNKANRGEKVAWERKQDNMIKLLAQIRPIEDKILDLMAEKTPILDQVHELRKDMVTECVHPITMLTYNQHDGIIVCKFCEKKFSIHKTDA